MTTCDQEIHDIHIQYADFYKIGGAILLVLIGVAIGAWIFGNNKLLFTDAMLGYAANVWTDLMSVILTVFVIDRLNERRDHENYKQDLIRQAGSNSNDFAIDAIEKLRKAGWLTGDKGALIGADLQGANLNRARMREANLKQANLLRTNLQQVILWKADLQESNLRFANLQQTNLRKANLKQANLAETNLRQTNLVLSNLRDAKNIETAKFDDKTVLPDAQFLRDENFDILKDEDGKVLFDKHWTPETDMTRYTNPDHPDFWQPDWAKEEGKEAG